MTIQNKFRVGIGITVVSAMVILVVELWASFELSDIQAEVAYGDAVRSHAVELNLLTSELLLHRSDRVKQQWSLAHQSFTRFLGNPRDLDPRVSLFTKEVDRRVRIAGQLYTRHFGSREPLYRSETDEKAATRFRISRILAEVTAVMSLTERIDDHLKKKRQSLTATLFITLSVAALTVFAGSIVIILYLVPGLIRRVADLREIIVDIGAGNLDREVKKTSDDELGDVYRATDRMRRSLLKSRQDLERANAGLSEARDNLEMRVRELNAVNAELEAFAYTISHDLRAPLRGMNGFSQALAEDYGEKLDETGLDYIQRISAAGKRMGQLIDDLLALSRVTRTEVTRSEVDLSEMAEGIAAQLKEGEPSRQVEFLIQPGIKTRGDPVLLRTVLENLMDNAWKYSARQARSVVEFGVTRDATEPIYFVRDNGVGFDMNYADKLFKPFHRLHGDQEFQGTGIGLASVANIVRRHGGRIWTDAQPGEGATFHFTLWMPQTPVPAQVAIADNENKPAGPALVGA